jgi:hypothetical protein
MYSSLLLFSFVLFSPSTKHPYILQGYILYSNNLFKIFKTLVFMFGYVYDHFQVYIYIYCHIKACVLLFSLLNRYPVFSTSYVERLHFPRELSWHFCETSTNFRERKICDRFFWAYRIIIITNFIVFKSHFPITDFSCFWMYHFHS